MILNVLNKNEIFKHRGDLFLMISSSLASSLFNFFTAVSLITLVNVFIEEETTFENIGILEDIFSFFNIDSLSVQIVVISLIIFFALNGSLKILSDYFIANLRLKFHLIIQKKIFKKINNNGWHFFNNLTVGKFQNIIFNEMDRVSSGIFGILHAVSSTCLLLFLIFIPMWISYKVTIISIAFGICVYFVIKIFEVLQYKNGLSLTLKNNKFSSIFVNSYTSFKSLLVNKKEIEISDNLNDLKEEALKLGIYSKIINSTLHETFNFLGLINLLFIFFLSKYFSLTLSEITGILYAFLRIIPLIGNIAQMFNSYKNSQASFENINYYILDKNKLSLDKQINNVGRKLIKDINEVNFKDVSYKFPNGNYGIKKIDFNLSINDKIGIRGPSGSGKSTIINLLLGLFDPTEGSVFVNKSNLKEINLDKYLSKISYVDNKNFLIPSTLRENLVWLSCKENLGDKEIEEALKITNSINFVKKLPNGLDTLLSEGGNIFSEGQKQRICLSGALLKKPKIFIIDEGFSHLDKENVEKICNNFLNIQNVMMIVVSHDRNVLEKFDQVMEIEDGVLLNKLIN